VKIEDYAPIVGPQVVDELRLLGERLSGRSLQMINSTAVGGGVAEILHRLVPLSTELGLKVRWDVLHGSERFYGVTKRLHNALHGTPEVFEPDDFEVFLDTTKKNLASLPLESEFVFVHDPQPIGLVTKRAAAGGRWLWRCHIDLSRPHAPAWDFLRPYVLQYDAAVLSAPSFAQSIPIRQFLIAPSIDPLSDKNRELGPETVRGVLDRFGITPDRPILTQISRFDRLKDPVGVVQAFQMVRRRIRCQLVLAGGTATDDPESDHVLAEVRQRADGDPDIHVLAIPSGSDVEINALQRASAVVVQKSLREGFGLTVSEALWKGRPVVASAVGGIPLQVEHRRTGLLCRTVEGCAHAIKQLLQNPAFANRLGENGRAHVRQNFLLTRHLKEYLLLVLASARPTEVVDFSEVRSP
jgi:trehalose synthase